MGIRRQAREAALQAIFMADFLSDWSENAIVLCFTHFGIPANVQEYAKILAGGVGANLVKIDSQITRASENWSVSRMGRVDRSIIRIATYEMLLMEEVPKNVAINEAIEIAKRFGTDESPTFVNGVLDQIGQNVRPRVEAERISIEKIELPKIEIERVEAAKDGAAIAPETAAAVLDAIKTGTN